MKKFIAAAALAVFFTSCGKHPQAADEKGDALSGTFTLHTDQAFLPLVTVLTDTYMGLYPLVNIRIDTSEVSNPYQCLSDSGIQTIVTSIRWNPNDSIALRQRKIFPKLFHFATDAVVIITRAGSDTLLKRYFGGRHDSCFVSCMNPSVKQIVTDRPSSENTRMFANEINKISWFAAGKPGDVMNRIAIAEDEAGIVGWSYLCERKNPEVANWKKKIQILPYWASGDTMIYPSQSSIAEGKYPLTRKIYLATDEAYTGPATGFAAWVASQEGQRIIRMFGTVPAQMPPREVYVH